MGVYIKGMEMPTRCCECLLAKLSPTGESIYCNYSLSTVPWDERPFDCPLVPVPPHGRLIDADALAAGLKEMSEIEWNQKASPVSWAYAFDAVRNIIERDEPTVIPAEEGET